MTEETIGGTTTIVVENLNNVAVGIRTIVKIKCQGMVGTIHNNSKVVSNGVLLSFRTEMVNIFQFQTSTLGHNKQDSDTKQDSRISKKLTVFFGGTLVQTKNTVLPKKFSNLGNLTKTRIS